MSNEAGIPSNDPNIAEAWAAADAGRLDDADRLFELASAGPNAAAAIHGRGTIAAKRGDLSRAAELFERACQLEPGDPLHHYQLGVAMLSTGRVDKAIRAFESCTRLDDSFGHAWFNLASARRNLGQPAEAIEAYRRAAAASRVVEDASLAIASTLRSMGSHDEAIQAARDAIASRESWGAAWNELGLCLAAKGDLETACSCWERTLELDPSLHEARYQIALALGMRGRLDEAERRYREVISRAPGHVPARINLAGLLMQKRDLASAEQMILAAAPHAGRHSGIVVTALADLRLRQDRLAEAERAYREAIHLLPMDLRCKFGLLGTLLGQERAADALAEIDRFAAAAPGQPIWEDSRAEAFMQLERHDEARATIERALAAHGPSAVRHALLGRINEQAGDLSAALASYDAALGIDPNFAPAAEGRQRVASG